MKTAAPYLLLAGLCLLLYLPGQATLPPVDRDEARFAQATRQMIQDGDYIRIRFQDTPRHKKPAGIHWLQAASVKVFSTPDSSAVWPYRIPSLLGAMAAVFLTLLIGRVLFDARVAGLGAALLASTALLVGEAHLAKTDASLLATVVAAQLALAHVYRGLIKGTYAGWGWALVFWVAIGASAMIKGPIGPTLVLLSVAALATADRSWTLPRRLRPLVGIPLALAIALPWYIAVMRSTGGAFVGDAFGEDLLPKLISGAESHGFPPGYYALLLPVTFWPASLLLAPMLVWGWRNRREPTARFLIAWILPWWILLELVPTKLPHYVLPVYPALALLGAVVALRSADSARALFRRRIGRFLLGAWAFMTLTIGAAVVAVPIALEVGFDPLSLLALAATIAIVVTVLGRVRRDEIKPAALAAVVGSIFVFAPTLHWVLPRTDTLWLSRSVQEMVIEREGERGVEMPRGVVASSPYREPSLVFLLGRETRRTSAAGVAAHLRSGSDALGLVGRKEEADLRAALGDGAAFLVPLGEVHGLEYTHGEWLTLTLYRLNPP